MSKPAQYPKPDLSHLSTKLMQVPRNRHQLEQGLLEWIKVRHQVQAARGKPCKLVTRKLPELG